MIVRKTGSRFRYVSGKQNVRGFECHSKRVGKYVGEEKE